MTRRGSFSRNRRGVAPLILAVIVVVVAVAVVVGGLFAAGVLKFSSGGGGGPSGSKYAVTFSETGLAKGATWSVTLGGSTSSSATASIVFHVTNNTYSFTVTASGYTATPPSGHVTVAGAAVSQGITFTKQGLPTVTFTETGLGLGASWTVYFNSTVGINISKQTSTSASIVFVGVSSGDYQFRVLASGYIAHPDLGIVNVTTTDMSVSVAFTTNSTYSVTFTESGLQFGTTWTVIFNGQTQQSISSSIIYLGVASGTYGFSVSAPGYTASPPSGTITVTTSDVTELINFTAAPPGTYSVTFAETGLASGTPWSVTLNGATQSSSTASIVFTEPNGSYTFAVGTVSGYTASPSTGTVTVAGTAVTQSISFTPAPPSGEYPVTFAQTGLPGNASWGVGLFQGVFPPTSAVLLVGGEAQGASFELALPNGNYFWVVSATNSSYIASPAMGNLTVASSPLTVGVLFTVLTPTTTHYPVTFTETGLPGGSTWGLSMNGTVSSASAGSPITYSVVNGTYYYTDVSTTATGYEATVPDGSVLVNGHGVTVSVDFIHAYPVLFTETGLSSGTLWEVTLNETEAFGSAGSSIGFSLPNGTYPFTVSATGYTASPASGTVTVSGASVSKAITFTPVVPPPMYTVTFTETGLPAGAYWGVAIYLDGSTSSAYGAYGAAATVSTSVPNGNYSWVVGLVSVSGYVAQPPAGGFTVRGAGASQSLSFAYAPSEHSVFFAEYSYWFFGQYGVPNGTSWSVTLANVTQSTTGMFVVFNEPNGTFSYTITPPAGYVAVPGTGTFTVNSTATGGSLFFSSAAVYVGFLSAGPFPFAPGDASAPWGLIAGPPPLRVE